MGNDSKKIMEYIKKFIKALLSFIAVMSLFNYIRGWLNNNKEDKERQIERKKSNISKEDYIVIPCSRTDNLIIHKDIVAKNPLIMIAVAANHHLSIIKNDIKEIKEQSREIQKQNKQFQQEHRELKLQIHDMSQKQSEEMRELKAKMCYMSQQRSEQIDRMNVNFDNAFKAISKQISNIYGNTNAQENTSEYSLAIDVKKHWVEEDNRSSKSLDDIKPRVDRNL